MICAVTSGLTLSMSLLYFRNENVADTMYKGVGTGSDVITGSADIGRKVDRVCDAMLTELSAQGENR